MIELAVIDDDRMLAEGMRAWIASVQDLRVVTAVATVDDLLGSPAPADVVLLDLALGDGSDPVTNVRRLVGAGHRVLVISVWFEWSLIVATFEAGSAGYLTKDHDLDALASAVRVVAAGGVAYSPELAFAVTSDSRPQRPKLSGQEHAVLVAYASGMTLKAAARHAGVRPETAKTYLERVKAKYHEVGRPAYTKLELAERVREDSSPAPAAGPASPVLTGGLALSPEMGT